MPLPQKIRITEVEDKKKELRSEDLTRSQLIFYVFEVRSVLTKQFSFS